MTEQAEEILAALSDEEREVLVDALRSYEAEGVARPLIPIGDIDGDGFEDSFGLSDDGSLIVVSGVPLEETVFVSTGGGIETDRQGDTDG